MVDYPFCGPLLPTPSNYHIELTEVVAPICLFDQLATLRPTIQALSKSDNCSYCHRLYRHDFSRHNTVHSTTRGLWATDHVILNLRQVTWMTPELATLTPPPLLTITPQQREDVSALDRFNLHRCPSEGSLEWYWARTHGMPTMIRYLDHWAIAALLSLGIVPFEYGCPSVHQ
ncbi:uncharacterized protein TNCV_2856181 [Trichonephila clavipes]|nr:uncharacterized protein TNCV_2856181 [Trichonephila clavipes]